MSTSCCRPEICVLAAFWLAPVWTLAIATTASPARITRIASTRRTSIRVKPRRRRDRSARLREMAAQFMLVRLLTRDGRGVIRLSGTLLNDGRGGVDGTPSVGRGGSAVRKFLATVLST